MARTFITGVAGFIGSNLARALRAAGEEVVGLDDFSTGRRENLEGIEGLTLHEGDLRELDLAALFAGCDYVLHQAAMPSVARSVDDPGASHAVNATGTLRVLEAARAAGVKRVVYASSSSAYGDTPVLPKVETMPPSPRSPYAVAKLTGEQYCRVYTEVYGLETVALRYFNVFGPYQDPHSAYAAVIPRFIRCALDGSSPPVFGDGGQTRDFTYIDNVIEANLKARTAPAAAGEAVNIAVAERVSLLELIDAINEALGTQMRPDHQPPRAGDVRDSLADISKAQALLGYEAKVGFREGLARTIAWYQGRP